MVTRKSRLEWDKAHTKELFLRYQKDDDLEARDELVTSYLNLVRFLARKFANRGEPLDDLIQVGTIGLIKAIDRFDVSKNFEFTTYATPTILGEIKRHFRDKGWAVRVPRRLQELSAKVNGAVDELVAELKRSPTISEIAAHLDTTPEMVMEAMESSAAYASITLETDDSGDNDDMPSLIDKLGIEDRDLENADNKIVLDELLAKLPEEEQTIVNLRFHTGLTQMEIARELDISQMQVSRLLRRALGELRTMLT